MSVIADIPAATSANSDKSARPNIAVRILGAVPPVLWTVLGRRGSSGQIGRSGSSTRQTGRPDSSSGLGGGEGS